MELVQEVKFVHQDTTTESAAADFGLLERILGDEVGLFSYEGNT